jgi:hypothetical protein
MKTLVLSLPRMGSKQITFNLYRYFRAKGDVSQIYPIIDIEPSLDEYLNIWHHRFKCKLIRNGTNLIRTDIPIEIVSDEIEHRINILKELNGPYVIKHFPTVYTLYRNDIFSSALSVCVSEISKSWIKSVYQQNIISKLLNVPITVPVNRFGDVIRQILQYNKTYYAVATHKIEFNDICAATNSYEFCKLMDLEYIDFDFIMLGKEFGDNKEQMVSNIDELKGIYDKLTYQCLY